MTTRSKAIRTAPAAVIAAALALWPGSSLTAETNGAPPSVSVTSVDGAYHIEGSFRVETSPAVAWEVLTDYDNLAAFVSSMRASAAVREGSGRVLVSQEAEGRLGPVRRSLHVVLEVTEERPIRVAFRDVCRRSFHSYDGAWTIAAAASGVQVTYRLEARPRSSPPLFARSILASNTRGLLDQVAREIRRRAGAPGGSATEAAPR